ncbi:MAG: hypothetical protein Q4P13_07370 [Psychrobacter sp.]|nr:hypothetical protein [Psychrobacter sp.]
MSNETQVNKSAEQVAYDLTTMIVNYEESERLSSDPRHYILGVYQDCLQVVKGGDFDPHNHH